MSSLVNTPIVDKNGVQTTRNKRAVAAPKATSRIQGVQPKAAVMTSELPIEIKCAAQDVYCVKAVKHPSMLCYDHVGKAYTNTNWRETLSKFYPENIPVLEEYFAREEIDPERGVKFPAELTKAAVDNMVEGFLIEARESIGSDLDFEPNAKREVQRTIVKFIASNESLVRSALDENYRFVDFGSDFWLSSHDQEGGFSDRPILQGRDLEDEMHHWGRVQIPLTAVVNDDGTALKIVRI